MSIFSQRYRSSKALVRQSGGFTIIELLFVIAIIAILAMIILTSLSSARVKARDGQRLTDMDTMQGAIDQYYRDNGHYPVTTCSGNVPYPYVSYDDPNYVNNVTCAASGGSGTKTLAATLAPYLSASLKDPRNPGGDAGYLYTSNDGTSYCILMLGSPENLNNFPTKNIPSTRCTAWDSNGKCTAGPTGYQNAIYFGTYSPTKDFTSGC
jgi:prepilin-type N-terminal cleavage/methylation domain-containing protein